MNVFFSRYRFLFLLIVIPLLSACSSVFLYRNLHWISLWYIDDYISLTADQKKIYTSKFNELQQWHREYELENYQLLLSGIQLQINSRTLSEKELGQAVNTHHQTIRGLWQKLAIKLSPYLHELSLKLSEPQKQELLSNLSKKNQSHYEKNQSLSREQWQQKKSRQLEKTITRWTGKLTEEQQALIQQWANNLHRQDKQYYQYRQQWLDELKIALSLPADPSRNRLTKLLAHRETFMPPKLRQQFMENQKQTEQLIVQVIATRSANQQKNIVQKLNHWLNLMSREITS